MKHLLHKLSNHASKAFATVILLLSIGTAQAQDPQVSVNVFNITDNSFILDVFADFVEDGSQFDILIRDANSGIEVFTYYDYPISNSYMFNDVISNLSPVTSYQIEVFVSGATKFGSGFNFVTTTGPNEPIIVTDSIIPNTQTTAIAYGNITYQGRSSVTESGVCWSTTGVPTVTDSKTSEGANSNTFNSVMSGLLSNTIYYSKAYATNSYGTSYGEEIILSTFDLGALTFVVDITNDVTVSLGGTVDVTIDWGDGSATENVTTESDVSHTYSLPGIYNISISGSLDEFKGLINEPNQMLRFISFGNLGLTSIEGAFSEEDNLISLPFAIPSTITNLSNIFKNSQSFNLDISEWDVSNVTNMSGMFWYAKQFNQAIGNWDVSNAADLSYMFYNAYAFNQPLGGWNVSNVTNMESMFKSARAFNQLIWAWDVSNVLNMQRMFSGAILYNQNMSSWDVDSVTNMSYMFQSAEKFNQSINSWNVDSVKSMTSMFWGAETFNKTLSSWNVGNVTNMNSMFREATAFNQNLSAWNIHNVTDMSYMFQDVTLSTTYYNSILQTWSALTVKNNVRFSAGNSVNSCGAPALGKEILESHGWIITDGGQQVCSITWNGSAWSPSTPTGTDNVYVSSGELEIGTNTTYATITVLPAAQLTLEQGITLTVTGDFTLQSNATGTATFVDEDGTLTVNGATTVQQYLQGSGDATPDGRWWYITPPVSGATSAAFDAAGVNKLWIYEEPEFAYSEISNNTIPLNPLQGYIARLGATEIIEYTGGTLQTGEYNLNNVTRTGTSDSKRGFNLIMNPYPSYLDWNAVIKTNIEPTIWYRTENTSNLMVFDTYNALSGVGTNNNGSVEVGQYIPPMQAVWVRVDADGNLGSIIADNSMRSHQDNNPLKEGEDKEIIRLQISKDGVTDETIIVFKNGASNQKDAYDSEKQFVNKAELPELYTCIGTDKMVINGVSQQNKPESIPLGFKVQETGEYTISTTEIEGLFGQNIVLHDKQLGITQDVTQNGSYTFTTESGEISDRFEILLKSATEVNTLQETDITIVSQGTSVVVTTTEMGAVTITDMLGRVVVQKQIQVGNTSIELPKGMYILTVKTKTDILTQKVIL